MSNANYVPASVLAEQAQVGSELSYVRWGSHHGSIRESGASKVKKINRYGHLILENGKIFDKTGDERAKFNPCHLTTTASLEQSKSDEEARRSRNEAVRKIEEILRGCRNGCGDSMIRVKTKADLLAAVEAIVALPDSEM